MVRPVDSHRVRISSCSRWRVRASRGAKGSSIISTSGSMASTRAMAARFFMPPESARGKLCSKPLRPILAISSRAISRRTFFSTPRSSMARATLSSTVRQGSRESAWEIYPTEGETPCTGLPSMRACPPVGTTCPANTFRAVDLPQPEGPTRATSSPRSTVRFR